jgi:hypothetical protein
MTNEVMSPISDDYAGFIRMCCRTAIIVSGLLSTLNVAYSRKVPLDERYLSAELVELKTGELLVAVKLLKQ